MKKTASVLSIILALMMVFSVVSSAADALTLTSVIAGSVDMLASENPEISSGDSIVITFSNNVTDESVFAGNIANISVVDSNQSPVSTISLSEGTERQSIVVSLGDISKGSYTLVIGEISSKKGSPYEGTSIAFTVKKGSGTGTGGGNNPLAFAGATVNGETLGSAELEGTETIAIAFNRGMKTNEADNANLICVVKADGTKADYTVLPVDDSQEETKRIVNVKLNGLEGGEYTLKIGADVKANNGNTLGKEETVNFTVKAQEEEPEEEPTGIMAIINAIVAFFTNIINYIKNFFTGLFGA